MPPRSQTLWGPVGVIVAGTVVFTVPDDRVAIVKRVQVVNATSTARTLDIRLDNGASGLIRRSLAIPATGDLVLDTWWAMGDGDFLTFLPSSGPNHLVVTGFGALLFGDAE